MSEIFSEQRWIGEFFVPTDCESRFPGEISYSAEEGVVLRYTITGVDAKTKSSVLHGVLLSGDRCTLIGQFDPDRSGYTIRNGFATRPGVVGFSFLVIGGFLEAGECFEKLKLSLTNLQDFFYPSGFKDRVKFSTEPIHTVTTPYGTMKVGTSGTFSSADPNIESYFYTENQEALSALQEAFESVRTKFPESFLMHKKDVSYRINLEFSTPLDIPAAYEHVVDISNLFALLIYNPVYPDSISLIKPAPDGHTLLLELYPSIVLDPRTVKLAEREQSHWHLPLNQASISFDSVFRNWLHQPKINSSVVTSVQLETGFRDEHSAQVGIVLYATQLESISHLAGETKRKYEFGLETHGSPELCEKLKSVFGTTNLEETAIAVGDLRNEIAHVGRPKKWLETLNLGDLVSIEQYLQLTVISYILSLIGVTKSELENYQAHYAPPGRADS